MDSNTPDSTAPVLDPNTITVSMEQLAKVGLKTKSDIIRFLDKAGYSRSAIAKFLNVKYQHVRNVLTIPQKRVIKAEREAQKRALLETKQSSLLENLKTGGSGLPFGILPEDLEREGFSVFDGVGPVVLGDKWDGPSDDIDDDTD